MIIIGPQSPEYEALETQWDDQGQATASAPSYPQFEDPDTQWDDILQGDPLSTFVVEQDPDPEFVW